VSGGYLPARPLFGKTTEYFRWGSASKFWELNNAIPSIKGDHTDVSKLKSFTRRFRVASLGSAFTADATAVNVEKRVFEDADDLSAVVQSSRGCMAYHRVFLRPFIRGHTAEDCIRALKQPSQATGCLANQNEKQGIRT